MTDASLDCVPFLSSKRDSELLKNRFRGATCVRVRLNDLESGYPVPKRPLWIDTALDGYPDFFSKSDWAEWAASLPGHESLVEGRLTASVADELVEAVCGSAAEYDPKWLTIPQLPQSSDKSNLAINRVLAKAYGKWLRKSGFAGVSVLPIVFTHASQTTKKGSWGPRMKAALTRYRAAGASGVWIVDATMDDQAGTKSFETQRFPALIDIHEYAAQSFPGLAAHVAGPYWGLNLVLWARGIISHPAVSLSGVPQYRRPGAHLRPSSTRIALPPLRKLVVLDQKKLGAWLRRAIKTLGPDHPGSVAFTDILDAIRDGTLIATAPSRVADFYESWIRLIRSRAPEARSVALYQDLSEAFVTGKFLDDIPGQTGRSRIAFLPAQQLMLHCM